VIQHSEYEAARDFPRIWLACVGAEIVSTMIASPAVVFRVTVRRSSAVRRFCTPALGSRSQAGQRNMVHTVRWLAVCAEPR